MFLKDHYQEVLNEIVNEHGIPRIAGPSHVVAARTGWTEVVQHTEWYVGGSGDSRPHYRYRRYREAMCGFKPGTGREALVDLGCGAGLFSWVFLDWASLHGMSNSHVDLYGLDHCPAMLQLALTARQRLLKYVPDYPKMRCSDSTNGLLNLLTENHTENTEYTITLGHVLVQDHGPRAIENFTRVIEHVMGLNRPGRNCSLVAVDAAGEPEAFAEGWTALLASLSTFDVECEDIPFPSTQINDSQRAKLAWLTLSN